MNMICSLLIRFGLAILVGISCLSAQASGGGGDAKKASPKSPAKRSVTTLRSWVDIEPFTVSVIQNGRISGTFMLAFGLDIPDDALRTKCVAILPRLRNNWLIAINRHASTYLRPRTPADLVPISAMLQKIADETLGQPGSKVLLSQAIVTVSP